MRIILLGLPGIGKGTQAAKIAGLFAVPHISTGDIFRDPGFKETERGREVARIAAKGELVPDDLVVDVVLARLGADDCANGYILDGFPRTVVQAEAFDRAPAAGGGTLDGVLFFDGDDEIVIDRLSGRRTCSKCRAVYHVSFKPPREENVCDECGGELYIRDDDRVETVKNRIAVYRRETRPLIDYYEETGLLRTIDGAAGVDEVFEKAREALGKP